MIKSDRNKAVFPIKVTMLSLFVMLTLSGCGIRGSLKTPPPVFGEESKVDPDRVPKDDLDNTDTDDDGFIDLDAEAQNSQSGF